MLGGRARGATISATRPPCLSTADLPTSLPSPSLSMSSLDGSGNSANEYHLSEAGGNGGEGEDGRETPYLRPLLAGRRDSGLGSADGLVMRRRRAEWLLVVVPPPVLLSAFSSSSSTFSGAYGPAERFQSGVLMPLQRSLSAQAVLIAREYGLPSISGLSLYCVLPGPPSAWSSATTDARPSSDNQAPRVTAATWPTLWSTHLANTGDGHVLPLASGLPIAGRIEFDFDLARATWLRDLIEGAASQSRSTPHPFEILDAPASPAVQAQIRSLPLDKLTDDGQSTSVHAEDDDVSVLADYIETTQSSTSIRTSTPRASITSLPPTSIALPPLMNDSGYAEPSVAAKGSPSISPKLNRDFTFPPSVTSPAPVPALSRSTSRTVSDAGRLGENDWTAQLDRLREISETSMLDGVEHASQLGSFDASGSLGELLMSIVEERDEEVAPSPSPAASQVVDPAEEPDEAMAATELVSSTSAWSPFKLPYPAVQPYPPVYPAFDLYPHIERFGTEVEREREDEISRSGTVFQVVGAEAEPFVPDIALSLAVDSTPSSGSYEAPSLPVNLSLNPLAQAVGRVSPLPSPTITPASMSRSSNASSSETHDYPVDFDDYTLEVTDALSSTLDYSGELDSPPLDVDEYFVLETGRARLNGGGDDSERDADSQSSAEEEDAMDEKLGRLVENDDACRTFDMPPSPLPPPPEPVLFAFPSLTQFRDLLDAVALFLLEAQDQSIGRQGVFSVAVGGTDDALSLLLQALEGNTRVRWDRWMLACPSALPDDVIKAFIAAAPLARVQQGANLVHQSDSKAQNPGEGAKNDQTIDEKAPPRFDLVLLDVAQHLARLGNSELPAPPAKVLDDLVSKQSNDPFSIPHLAASRRLAYVAIGAVQHAALRDLLSSGDTQTRLDLANGHPAVVFADDDAVGDLDYPRSAFWDGEEELVQSPVEA